jgi:hypothetical protein
VGAAHDNNRPLPADTWSRSLCLLLATVAGIDSAHLRESRSRQIKSADECFDRWVHLAARYEYA